MYNCYKGSNQFTKICCHRLGLLFSWCAPKVVEADVEPVVDITVQFVVLITYLLRSQTLLNCLCLRSCTILVRSTDIQDVVIPQSTEPGQRMNRISNVPRQNSESRSMSFSCLWTQLFSYRIQSNHLACSINEKMC